MRRILAFALLLLPFSVGTAQGAVDPVTCQGYPEHRIFLENQSWWSPQLADPSRPNHPGTGQTGHIHIGTCFPAYQNLTADALDLDVNVKLHNHTGTSVNLRVYAYGDFHMEFNGTQAFNRGKCDAADCETWMHVSFPLSAAQYKGWHEFAIFLNVITPDAQVQRNWTRYYVYIDRPLPSAPAGSVVDLTTRPVISGVNSVTGGDSWYSKIGAGGASTSQYAQAKITRVSIPWDEQTGQLIPLSGVWTPKVGGAQAVKFVYIDPALHAVPENHGTVVFESPMPTDADGFKTLSIDTTQLTDGLHRLLIGTSNVAGNGTNSGVLVVPFLVKNS